MNIKEMPASPVEGLYYPTPVTPEEAFQAIGRLRKEARDEIDRLIQFLDKTDDYVSRELEINEDDSRQEEADLEPTLGAADRIVNQDHAWGTTRWGANQMDGELDDSDHEESDPAEHDDTGIGDLDGLMEQHPVFYGSNGQVQ